MVHFPTDLSLGLYGTSLCPVDQSINTFASLPGVRQLVIQVQLDGILLPKPYLVKKLTK